MLKLKTYRLLGQKEKGRVRERERERFSINGLCCYTVPITKNTFIQNKVKRLSKETTIFYAVSDYTVGF